MKKLLAIGFLVLGFIFLNNTNAQAQTGLDLGAGLAYGSEVDAIGLQVGAVYNFTQEVSGAADFTYYFPDNYDFYAFNVNVHYAFFSEANTKVYGLAGFNYATQEFDLGSLGSASNSEAGLNLGGGAEFGLAFAKLFGEIKYVVSDYDQLALAAGLRFGL